MSSNSFVLLVTVLALASVASAFPLNVPRSPIEFVQPKDVPAGWERVDTAAPDHLLNLTISLTNRNLDRLEALFWERTNPSSPTWRQWLSLEELTELITPADSVIATARAWLLSAGIVDVHLTASRDFLVVRTTVAKATQLLNAEFSQWRHTATGRLHVCTLGPYSAPAPLAAHIDYIAGVWGFPTQKRVSIVTERNQLAENPNPNIKPADLLQAYNCSYTATNSGNSFSVAEFQSQFYAPTDLSDFFARYVPGAPASAATKVTSIGLNLPNSPGVEASLDIEYAMGVAPGVQMTFWSNPSFNFWSDLTSWMQQIADTPNAPWVHSVSYGDQRESQQPSSSYKDSLSAEFQKAGVRGLSIIFASGDSGAGCHLCTSLEPSFPATSPYVTSVGATRFTNGVGSEEAAVESFKSGGGFSYHFDTAPYQKDAVQTYLNTAKGLPPSTAFNAGGRATPDVSALGIGYTVVVKGKDLSIGGTSASTPTFSALITLLNDKLFNANKPALGFLNQWIYQTDAADPAAFTDITIGDNKQSCCPGFPTARGWDPVTGVGTPNFGVLAGHIGL